MAQTKTTTKTTATKRTAKAAPKKPADSIEATIEKTGAEFADMFSAQNIEVPEFVRQASENVIANAKEGYDKIKVAAEDATDVLEETVQSARNGFLDIQSKSLEAARDNSDSAFAFAKDIMSTTSAADAIQLQTAFVRERFEAAMDYARSVQETASEVSDATTRPARDAFAKIITDAKAA